MDFNQIRYFLALADTLNFTRAAERCYVSQPALTQAIKRLENELGGELISREGKYTELTELGKSLRGHFERIDHTRHLVRTTAKVVTSGEITELNIGIMCTLGPRVIAGMLDEFQTKFSDVAIVIHDVTPNAIPELLLSGGLDGAFCAYHGNRNDQLVYVDLFEEALVVAFPDTHEFLELSSVPLEEITKHRYIDRLHCEFREGFLEFCAGKKLDLNVAFRSQRKDWIQSLIREGAGVSIIPRFSLLKPELDYRDIIDPELMRTIGFAVTENQSSAEALNAFIKLASEFQWSQRLSCFH